LNKEWLISETGDAIRYDAVEMVYRDYDTYSNIDRILVSTGTSILVVKKLGRRDGKREMDFDKNNTAEINQIIQSIINGKKLDFRANHK
jgi:hypothetical protein